MHTPYTLKKSAFLAGRHCVKRMWWETHDSECAELNVDLPTQVLFDQGNRVHALALEGFPNGVLINRDKGDLKSWQAATRDALANAAVPAIFEACFVAKQTLVFVDVLERRAEGFAIVEVKQSTSVTEDHIADVALQVAVLRESGVRVCAAEIMYLNRESRSPDLTNLFLREDVTISVDSILPEIDRDIARLIDVSNGQIPTVEVGAHCATPRECPFMNRCWPETDPDNIRYLYRLNKGKVAAFERQGIRTITDLPPDLQLSSIALRQRRAFEAGKTVVEGEALLNELKKLEPPVAHIDFETVMLAIPIWDGCRPYDNIPVQFSAHTIDGLGNSRHDFWITEGASDPRPQLAEALIAACADARTITAYNAAFEKRCIEGITEACPTLAPKLTELKDKIVDLLPMVRENVYHPEFRGSFSLKRVLPALVPEMRYDDLKISDGETASALLTRLMFDGETFSPGEREEIRESLLQYCQRDTEAMVALTQALQEGARNPDHFKNRELIYQTPKPDILLVKGVSDELLGHLSRYPEHRFRLNPRLFEETVAELLARMGYDVQLTPQSGDDGRDVLALIPTPTVKLLMLVECKRYAPHRLVGIEPVTRVWSRLTDDKANLAMVVTTSGFLPVAQRFATSRGYQVSLKNGHDFVNWIRAVQQRPRISV